jgi:hypothetical protein
MIEDMRWRRTVDDRNGVRSQDNVRFSLYSSGGFGVRVIRGEQDQKARR